MSQPRIALTSEDMLAARDGSAGFEKVYTQVQPIIGALAYRSASQVGASGAFLTDLRDELEAAASAFLWDLILRFEPRSTDIGAYIVASIDTHLRDARREILSPGADPDAMKLFLRALRSPEIDGDTRAAERAIVGPKCSADRAYAARMAYEGAVSLDMPVRSSDYHTTLADTIADERAYVPGEELETNEARAQRNRMVRDTLELMSPLQASILSAFYGVGLSAGQTQEVLDIDGAQFKRSKEKGRRSFHALFPWEVAYGSEKPAYKSERDIKAEGDGNAAERWNAAKLRFRVAEQVRGHR